MSPASSVSFTAGTPETVLPPPSPEVRVALEAAAGRPPAERQAAFAGIASSWPRCLDAWAGLAESAQGPIDRYAFARVGYHRGLDTLRAAGWRGSGYVRWTHPSNRGFLRCLEALRGAAQLIGESDEEERCAIFLRQLDPEWPPPGLSA
ncbi:MAG TPA: DUF3151 family protein [Acidimicrobiales bacterium]|nr:DUF3151 family protein [Acidimicrobiales bacterium]